MTKTQLPRVMVVDDDPNILMALTARLKHSGYEVCSARDAMAALSEFDEFKPDVAILDINLPGIDGTELAARLDEQDGGVGKIFLTASKDPEVRRRTSVFADASFMEKPFDSRRLLEEVDYCIEKGV